MFSTISFLRVYAIVIFVCLLYLGVATLAFEIVFNACSQNEDHIKLQRQTLISCVQTCNCFSGCSFAGYSGKTAFCDIYKSQPDINDRICPGYFLISKSSAEDIARRTHQIQCISNEIKVCQESFDDTMLLGNLNTIDSQRSLKCKPSEEIDGKQTTNCFDTGHWSVLGTCKNVCPMIEFANRYLVVTQIEVMTAGGSLVFKSADSINSPLFVGTNVSLECIYGTLNGDEIVTCVNGTWTQSPVCKGSIRESCQANIECTDTASECRNDTCRCKPKLSYDPCSLSCVDVCPRSYGDTFQIVKNFAIRQSNRMQQSVADAAACMDLCLKSSNPAYVCKYVDYKLSTRICKLNNNPTEGEPDFEIISNYNFFQRDCANCDL